MLWWAARDFESEVFRKCEFWTRLPFPAIVVLRSQLPEWIRCRLVEAKSSNLPKKWEILGHLRVPSLPLHLIYQVSLFLGLLGSSLVRVHMRSICTLPRSLQLTMLQGPDGVVRVSCQRKGPQKFKCRLPVLLVLAFCFHSCLNMFMQIQCDFEVSLSCRSAYSMVGVQQGATEPCWSNPFPTRDYLSSKCAGSPRCHDQSILPHSAAGRAAHLHRTNAKR